jgi:hypothetical protein
MTSFLLFLKGVKRPRIFLYVVLLFLFSSALALFATLSLQARSFNILEHSYRFSPLPFLAICVAFSIFLILLWGALSYWDEKYRGLSRASSLRENLLPFFSLLFFFIAPFLTAYYLTRNDLVTRLDTLGILILLCFLSLRFIQLYPDWKTKNVLRDLLNRFIHLPVRKRLIILFFVAFVIYNGCAFVLVSQGITFSGDEPYYLLTTHSLYQDKDINVANNYANKDYFHYYSREKNPKLKLGVYARAGKKGRSTIYPINLSGVSVIVLPYYWLSRFFQGNALTFILKSSLSLWAVLLGLQLYLLSREFWQRERLSLLLWLLYSFTAPVLFYAIHIYPEIPIALFSIYIFRKVCSKNPLSLAHHFFLGFLLSLFLWFGLKYNLIFWPLALVSVYFLLKEQKTGLKILGFLVFPLLSLFLFYLYLYALYGSFHPFSIYEGVMTPEKIQAFKEMILKIPILLRTDTFLDYFLDQRDGLFLYSWIYLFSLPGLIEVFRRSKKLFFSLLLISLPYIINYAFLSHRQGYCPQGRVLTPLSWVGALLIGSFLAHNRRKVFSLLFGLVALASLFISSALVAHPSFLYQPTTHEVTSRAGELFVHFSNMYFFMPKFLPSLIKVDNTSYLPNYIWVLAIIAFVLVYAFTKKDILIKKYFAIFLSFLVLFLLMSLWIFFPRSVLYPTKTYFYSPQKAMGFYFFPMGKGVVAKKMSEFYLHREKSYTFLFSSRSELEKVRLNFGSEKGDYEVRMKFFDLPLYDGRTSYEQKGLLVTPPAHYAFKKLFLYEITLDLKKLSSESMLIDPYFFQVLPER